MQTVALHIFKKMNNGQAELNLAIVLQKSGNNKLALVHAEKAKSLGVPVDAGFVNQLKR